MQELRFFLFPEARKIASRTAELDLARVDFKRKKQQTDEIVKHANRPDVLRNLVIAMTEDKSNG